VDPPLFSHSQMSTAAQLAATVDYYLARTAHGSTLNRGAHALGAGRDGPRPGLVKTAETLGGWIRCLRLLSGLSITVLRLILR
jgi:hypothetical protein